MASTIPALRGTFGSFEYWLTTMHVSEVVQKVIIPKDMEGWESLTIEERYQRDINLSRVKKEIAPYFAKDPDRFSSALILAVINDDEMAFEPLDTVGNLGRLPQLYKAAANNIGFLTFAGSEVFVPLDGQHRAKALKYAVSGKDDNNTPLDNVPANTSLGAEDLAVVLVRFDPAKSRKIFNKVNRYAKPTPKGQNLITDDDDPVAVITRRVVSEDVTPPSRLVRIQSNTLSAKAPEFTTLSTLYDSNIAIIEDRFSVTGRMTDAPQSQLDLYYDHVLHVWELLLEHIDLFNEALDDPSEAGDAVRQELRREMLLGKPIAQQVVVRAFLLVSAECPELQEEAVCDRLNKINWSIADPLWHGVLMNPNGRIMYGKTTVNTAVRFVAYLCGMKLTEEEEAELVNQIAGDQEYTLPDPVV